VSIEDARDVLVTVLAETALNYVELRNGQERVRIARANIELQARTLELTENQFRAGLVSQLDVAQARTNLESSRATLPPLEAGQREARNRLAVILGVFPGTLDAELEAVRPIPAPSIDVAVGVPADLLRRRPDIRRAERALAAQTARIGLAEADLYPRFALFGSIGLEAEDASDLLRPGAATFGFGPSVSWNIFDRGRVRRNIAVQNARQEQALIQYERAVLTALEEVENSMTRFVRDQVRRDSLERAVVDSRRSVELSREQYRRGLVGFQSVLDTQRRLFELEDDLALTSASIASDLIRLYKALGGGWESILAPLHTAKESRP
jgi:multidrug efflux system outer membrane protein